MWLNMEGWLCWLVVFSCFTVIQSSDLYYMAVPTKVFPGKPFTMTIFSSFPADSNIMFTAKLIHPDTKAEIYSSSNNKPNPLLELQATVPREYNNIQIKLELNMKNSSYEITNTTMIMVAASSFMIIQTDKGLYKKSDTVQIRIVMIDPSTRPVSSNVTVIIKDPKGNRVDMKRDLEADTGVAKTDFLLSDDPMLGEWKIEAEQSSTQAVQKAKAVANFKVDKFVLPRFEVEVTAPATYSNDMPRPISVIVKGRYTFGENVVGEAMIVVTTKNSKNKLQEVQMLQDGSTSFTLPSEKVKLVSSGYDELKIKATVTEASSKIQLSDEATIKYMWTNVKLVVDKEPYYVLGAPYYFCVKVLDQNSMPLPQTEKAKYYINITDNVSRRTKKVRLQEFSNTDLDSYNPSTPDIYCHHTSSASENGFMVQLFKENEKYALSTAGVYPQRFMASATEKGVTALLLTPWDYQTEKPRNKEQVYAVGDTADFKLQIITPNGQGRPTQLVVQTYSKGSSDASTRRAITPQGDTEKISFTITEEMAPDAVVIVYGFSGSVLIATSQRLPIKMDLEKGTSMSYGKEREEVGKDVTLTVQADPGSFVAVAAIDKGSELLEEPNYVTVQKVLEGIKGFNSFPPKQDPNPGDDDRIMFKKKRSIRMPYNVYTTSMVFKNSGLNVISNAEVFSAPSTTGCPFCGDIQPFFKANAVAGFDEKFDYDSSSDISTPETKVRKSFPETWLWLEGKTSDSSTFEITKTLPDSITAWVTSAFVISPLKGVRIPVKTQIESFKSFFLVLEVPPYVIQGEKFEVKVLAFNYVPDSGELTVTATVKGGDDVKIWKKSSTEPENQNQVTDTLKVRNGHSAMFAVYAKKLSNTDIFKPSLTLGGEARTAHNGKVYQDRLEKVISAEPEGRRVEKTKTYTVENGVTPSFSPANIFFPNDAVKGSKSVYVKAVGDVLGQALNNPEGMVQVPFGCGEQNIASTVPNIFVMRYLRASNIKLPELEKRATRNIMQGCQKELLYQRVDNSFSAFGDSDGSGSTWLTAFVLKSFAQARMILPDVVDPLVVSNALKWLNRQVSSTGVVTEPGRVIHREMQGSSHSKEKLAAFVLSCYVEVHAVYGNLEGISDVITRLKKPFKADSDTYYLALMTYAQSIIDSSNQQFTDMTNELLNRATEFVKDGVKMQCWGKDCNAADEQTGDVMLYYNTKPPKPSSIEMSGYVLMALVKANRLNEARPIMRWLNSKQNALGGWCSTQDTVIGLQAMAEFAKAKKSVQTSLTITLIAKSMTGTELKRSKISITNSNKLLLQKKEFPLETRSIQITSSGPGNAVITVIYHYNVKQTEENKNMTLKVNKYKINENELEIRSCVRYTGAEPSNMVLLNANLGTGVGGDFSKLEKNRNVARFESERKGVNIYINEVTSVYQCFSFVTYQNVEVNEQKEVAVHAYQYYNTDVSATVYYDPSPNNASKPTKCYAEDVSCSADHVTTVSLTLILMFLSLTLLTILL